MSIRIIKTNADIREATTALTVACPAMARIHAATGAPPLRRRANGFPGLARIIIGQQLSVASAGAIWGRVEATVAPFEPGVLLESDDEALKACGLSVAKVKTLRGIATAIETGEISLKSLSRMHEDKLRARLLALKGIGPWTADVYIMFCLGRADGWAPGDLALQHAVRDILDLSERPDQKEMVTIAERWRPWRSVAARLLWAYYAHRKTLASATPL